MSAAAPVNGQTLLFDAYTAHKEKVKEFAKHSLSVIQKRSYEVGQRALALPEIKTFSTKVAKLCSKPSDVAVNASFIVAFLEKKIQILPKAVPAKKADLQIVKLFQAIVAGTWSISEDHTKQSAAAPATPNAKSAAAPATPAAAAGAPNSPLTPSTPEFEAFVASCKEQFAATEAAALASFKAADSALATASALVKGVANEIHNLQSQKPMPKKEQ
jgi:hypothetical protein